MLRKPSIMNFDESDEEEVSFETFKKCHYESNSSYFPGTKKRNKDKLIIEISAHASENTENHMGLLIEVLNSDQTTEEMIQKFEPYSLSNMTETELIKVIVHLINRFQYCSQESPKIHLSHVLSCLNDVRLMLVILSKKFIANEFIYVYKMPVWKYLKSYLKYLSGLIKIESSATASICKHEVQLVHMFNMLASLFNVKQVQDELRLDFMGYLVTLFFSSTSGSINQAISHVICTAICKYDWMDIYLYELFKYDTDDESVRTKFNFTVNKKKYYIHSTTMLLIQLIDYEIDLNLNEDIEKSMRKMFTKSYQIINLALKYNQKVLVALMKDLNKMSADLTQIPKCGTMVFYNYVLLIIREMVIRDRILSSEHGEVIDAYFEMMTQVCTNFKQVANQSKHLDFSPDTIYELLDKVDNAAEQFTLLSIMFSTNILSPQPLSEEDKAILKQSKLTFTVPNSSAKRKSKKGEKENKAHNTQTSRVGVLFRAKQSDIALCFNYFINERLHQTVLVYCLQTILNKLRNAQSQACMQRHVKYMSNLKHFCSKSYKLLDNSTIMITMSVMYEMTKTCENKAIQQEAVSIICNFCSKRDSDYNRFKKALRDLLKQTDNPNLLKTLCEFFLGKFQDQHEKLGLIVEQCEQDNTCTDIELSIIDTLLLRLKYPNLKPIILSFFSKLWFEWETLSSKLDHKVEQMIKLVGENRRGELKVLIKEFFDQSGDIKKSTVLCIKQIVNNVIQSKKDDSRAWEIVLYFSEVKSNYLVEYLGELYELVKDLVAAQDFNRFKVLAKVVSNIIAHNKENIKHDELQNFKGFLARTLHVKLRQDIKIICIEMMRFFNWEENKIKKNFFNMYGKIKKGLELSSKNVTGANTNENSYTLKEFFCDVLTLSAFLNNWPEIIAKSIEFKDVHIALVQVICRYYYRTENRNDRELALRSLGKIHTAFHDAIQSDKVVALYRDILENSGDDALKHLVIINIYCHINEIKKRLETIEANDPLKLKSVEHKLLDHVSITVNIYLSFILNAYYTIRHADIRTAVTKFLIQNLKFGTLVAHQVVAHMIPMLQEEDPVVVYQELEAWNKMEPTLLVNNFRKGTINSYKLAELIWSVESFPVGNDENNNSEERNKLNEENIETLTPRGYKTEKNCTSPRLAVMFDLVQKRAELFLKMLVKHLEEVIQKVKDSRLFVYIVDNIALFHYNTLPQLRTVIYELEAIVSSKGAALLELESENNQRIYQTYSKMAKINLLIKLKSFLCQKYVIPSDLMHNNRYETLKLKLKPRTSFDQVSELKSISKHVAKLFVKQIDAEEIKMELHMLRGIIAKEVLYRHDSDDSEELKQPDQLHDEYMASRANKHTESTRKSIETLAKETGSEQPQSFDKTRKSLDVDAQIQHTKETNPKKQFQVNVEKKTSSDGQKEKPQKRSDGNKTIIHDNINEPEDANKNRENNFTTEAKGGEKKSYKDIYKLGRPIPQHIVEKAKQANIDWMITKPSPAELKPKSIRKSQVQFKIHENMEEDETTDGENDIGQELPPVHDEINSREVQISQRKKTAESVEIEIEGKEMVVIITDTERKKTDERIELNHRETEKTKRTNVDDIIDGVVNNTIVSSDDDMVLMNLSKKFLKRTPKQNEQQSAKVVELKKTQTNLDDIFDSVINNTVSRDNSIDIKTKDSKKQTIKRPKCNEPQKTKIIEHKKKDHTNLDDIIDAVISNTESSDDSTSSKPKESKTQIKNMVFANNKSASNSAVDISINLSGNEADDDDDLDFINDNKKRTKHQDASNWKKVKIMATNKKEKQDKKREQARRNMTTLMQNLMVSKPKVCNATKLETSKQEK